LLRDALYFERLPQEIGFSKQDAVVKERSLHAVDHTHICSRLDQFRKHFEVTFSGLTKSMSQLIVISRIGIRTLNQCGANRRHLAFANRDKERL
jgi:hypothetical protein